MRAPTLRARQQRFVDEYMVDLNATRAAIAAGYTKNTAAQAGWEVLRNPKVAAEVERRQRRLAARHEVSADNVISELAKIGFANLADFYTVAPNGRLAVDTVALADPTRAAAISSIEIMCDDKGVQQIKFKLADKRAALADLGKHLGLTTERHEVSVKPGVDEADRDIRTLALAALALINEASHGPQTAPPLQIEHAPVDDDFDL